ncbi:hypothetical protein SAMN05216308_109134 [Nitrosospira sp. Nsp13]|nr:hypothetical protein SAMN05216308_109134 [Nitrosospira sp. Nsp13]
MDSGEDCAEIQVMSEHHVVMGISVGHDFRVRRVVRAKH